MRTYDVTLTISPDIPVWPGDTPPQLIRTDSIAEGATANTSQITMSVHTGTHVDAPDHFLDNGKTVDGLNIELLMGRVYVLHLPDVELITAAVLERAEIPPRTRRLIFKTRNSDYWARGEKTFKTDFVALSADGAGWLVDRNVRLVGIDYLSIAPYHVSTPTHRILLEAGIVIVEGLDLSKVSQGRYTLTCLPLKLAGSDGAPARVVLVGV
ncbi:MAG: cyclase family protein [Anaerolineales bacterium]|nr:cyclase family protein [Anaerolineales bacterium]